MECIPCHDESFGKSCDERCIFSRKTLKQAISKDCNHILLKKWQKVMTLWYYTLIINQIFLRFFESKNLLRPISLAVTDNSCNYEQPR